MINQKQRKIVRRSVSVAAAAGLALTGLAVSGGPAQAAHLACGSVVTASTTLDRDLGPCPGDGLIVSGSGITLNLGGRTITGSNNTNTSSREQVGVRLDGASGASVINGTVRRFDAGVAIVGGSGNTVFGIRAQDNINHSSLTGALNPCLFGDGITTSDSANNRILGNQTVHNGPFSGISLVGNSDGNIVQGNLAADQTVPNVLPNGRNGPCGPFTPGGTVGRPDQDIGIRIEGPGANNNYVDGNTVTGNMLDGISVHGNTCNPPPPFPAVPPNTDNFIRGNRLSNNGFDVNDNGVPLTTTRQDGIGILSQGPLGTITCSAQRTTILGNTSINNARHGIFVAALSAGNTVNGNTVNGNGSDGIRLNGPFTVCPQEDPANHDRCLVPLQPRPGATDNTLLANRGQGNGEHDGDDRNPNCDNNRWFGNLFGTVNQACVANGGTGSAPPPMGAMAAEAAPAPSPGTGGPPGVGGSRAL